MKHLNVYMIVIAVFVAVCSGCAKEEIPVNSIKLLAAIKTGISIESSKQLATCRENVVQDAKLGNISSELEKELLDIIQLAEKGNWSEAEKRIIKIQKQCTLNPEENHPGHDHNHGHDSHHHKH